MIAEFFEHYLEIVTDPAHLLAEITFIVVIDVLVIGVVWPLMKRAIKREHRIVDEEHGYNHDAQEHWWPWADEEARKWEGTVHEAR